MDDEIVPVVTDWIFISHFLEGENVGNGFTAKPRILIKSLEVGNMREPLSTSPESTASRGWLRQPLLLDKRAPERGADH